jgi:hypothetical protein
MSQTASQASLRVMGILISTLSLTASATLIALLVQRGFRHGDRPSETRVSLVSIKRSPDGPGGWIEVGIDNPDQQTALIGLGLRPAGWPVRRALGHGRRSTVTRARRGLANQFLGAVRSGERTSFWVWSETDPARQIVRVLVGTTGRLRLHELPSSRAVDLTRWDSEPLYAEVIAGYRSRVGAWGADTQPIRAR